MFARFSQATHSRYLSPQRPPPSCKGSRLLFRRESSPMVEVIRNRIGRLQHEYGNAGAWLLADKADIRFSFCTIGHTCRASSTSTPRPPACGCPSSASIPSGSDTAATNDLPAATAATGGCHAATSPIPSAACSDCPSPPVAPRSPPVTPPVPQRLLRWRRWLRQRWIRFWGEPRRWLRGRNGVLRGHGWWRLL